MSAGPAPVFDTEAAFTLEGLVPPRRLPLAYRATLGLTALAMVLLPVLYVTMIFAVGYGVYWYAIHGLALFHQHIGGLYILLLYAGPLIAGAILAIFMIKPLFAPPAGRGGPLVLDLEREPRLREFIAAICAHVRAPMPAQVNLDWQVNASAGFRRGLSSVGRRDLVLTIGLPLVAGLDTRQFAGVLAHEFGHFAQGSGLTLAYLIRAINGWFARVVFERDAWDRELEHWASESDGRLALVLRLGQLAVWMGRGVLYGLMHVGHAITCLQSRQMEFDADYYQIHLAGSDAFTATFHELVCLQSVHQAALGEVAGLWGERRLVEDFPRFVAHRRAQLAPADQARLSQSHFTRAGQWFDTHPTPLARTIQAKALRQPGLARGRGPATAFFSDFETLSREITAQLYSELGILYEPGALAPVETVARAGEAENAALSARRRLVGDALSRTRLFVLQASDLAPLAPAMPPDLASVAAQLAARRAEAMRQREAAAANEGICRLLREELDKLALAQTFVGAGLLVTPEMFGVVSLEQAFVARRTQDLATRLEAKIREQTGFEASLATWARTIVGLARHPALAPRLPHELAARLDRTARALTGLAPWFQRYPEWQNAQATYAAVNRRLQMFAGNARYTALLNATVQRTRAIVAGAPELIGETPYPVSNVSGVTTVAAHLERELIGVDRDARLVILLRTVDALHFRLIGQLAAEGEELETWLATSARTSSGVA